MVEQKPGEFRGRALDDLRALPIAARREAGYQIEQVWFDCEPADWKPMTTIGAGVREIRIRDETGVYRVIYIAKFADAFYVLHCFLKRHRKLKKVTLILRVNATMTC